MTRVETLHAITQCLKGKGIGRDYETYCILHALKLLLEREDEKEPELPP